MGSERIMITVEKDGLGGWRLITTRGGDPVTSKVEMIEGIPEMKIVPDESIFITCKVYTE